MFKQVHNFLKEEAVGLGTWVFGEQMRQLFSAIFFSFLLDIVMINYHYAPETPCIV